MKEQILSFLPPEYPWKDRLFVFPELDSTNNRLKVLASQGAPHGTVLIADRQTGGRGRMGRSFLSPPGVGIYMSILLRPECAPQELMHLTCAVAAAMCRAVECAAGLRSGIKWTNDLVWGKQKFAGILTEMGLNAAGGVDWAIVGIGVNCCQKAEDFPPEIRDRACSLAMAAGREIDRCRVAAAMMEARMEEETGRIAPEDRAAESNCRLSAAGRQTGKRLWHIYSEIITGWKLLLQNRSFGKGTFDGF